MISIVLPLSEIQKVQNQLVLDVHLYRLQGFMVLDLDELYRICEDVRSPIRFQQDKILLYLLKSTLHRPTSVSGRLQVGTPAQTCELISLKMQKELLPSDPQLSF